jgi:hypothetical protein
MVSDSEKRERDWKRRGITFGGAPLTFEVFRAVVEFQGGKCALCNAPESAGPLIADHLHHAETWESGWTGEPSDVVDNFRGALCSDCNHQLGDAESAYLRAVLGGLTLTPAPRSEQETLRARFPKQFAYFDNPPAKKWAAVDARRKS